MTEIENNLQVERVGLSTGIRPLARLLVGSYWYVRTVQLVPASAGKGRRL